MLAPEKEPEDGEARYVLITQCLQNDFLLNDECRLSLPEPIVRAVLLGQSGLEAKGDKGVRGLPAKPVAAGPLGRFLEQTIGRRRRGEDGRGVLHVINIRDWHIPDDNYDSERRRYGAHCEAGTWERATSTASRAGSIRPARCRPRRPSTSSREASASTTCTPTRSSTSDRGAPTSGPTSASSPRPRWRSSST